MPIARTTASRIRLRRTSRPNRLRLRRNPPGPPLVLTGQGAYQKPYNPTPSRWTTVERARTLVRLRRIASFLRRILRWIEAT